MDVYDTTHSRQQLCVDEYIEAARVCLSPSARHCSEASRFDGRLMGYPAALLLFSAVDALGHSLTQTQRPDDLPSDLRLLLGPPFNEDLQLTEPDLQHIAHWFRNSLAHVGGLPDRIYLNGGDGPIFVRSPETGEIVSIGLPAFYEAVVQAWHCVRDDFIPGTIKHTDAKPCEPLEESCPPSHLVDATGTSGGPYVTRTSYGQWKRELVWAVKDAPPGSRFEFARVRPL